jgi:hypothetical protein
LPWQFSSKEKIAATHNPNLLVATCTTKQRPSQTQTTKFSNLDKLKEVVVLSNHSSTTNKKKQTPTQHKGIEENSQLPARKREKS